MPSLMAVVELQMTTICSSSWCFSNKNGTDSRIIDSMLEVLKLDDRTGNYKRTTLALL